MSLVHAYQNRAAFTSPIFRKLINALLDYSQVRCTEFGPNTRRSTERIGTNLLTSLNKAGPLPETARSKAWIHGHTLAGVAGLNPAGVCVLWVLCDVRQTSLRRADHSSREVLPSVVCL
jgi:hypothetical protein